MQQVKWESNGEETKEYQRLFNVNKDVAKDYKQMEVFETERKGGGGRKRGTEEDSERDGEKEREKRKQKER